jgi:FO synthase
MNETITRAAGAAHGEEMPPAAMERLIRSIGREPWQRTTLYQPTPAGRVAASFAAPPLSPPIETPLARRHTHDRATHPPRAPAASESGAE